MSSQEQEALARQLCALYWESVGTVKGTPVTWEDLPPTSHTAWIQVAQYVEAQMMPLPQVIVFNDMKPSDIDPSKKEWLDEQWRKIRSKRVWDQDRFIRSEYDEPDHK